jgi:hypothetical protein
VGLNIGTAIDLLLRYRYTTMKRVMPGEIKRKMERMMKRMMRRSLEGTMRIRIMSMRTMRMRTMRMRTMRIRTMRMRTMVIRSKFCIFIAQKCAGFSKNATYLGQVCRSKVIDL